MWCFQNLELKTLVLEELKTYLKPKSKHEYLFLRKLPKINKKYIQFMQYGLFSKHSVLTLFLHETK